MCGSDKKGKRLLPFFAATSGLVDRRSLFGAGNEARTRDLNLGKVALYQLSYSRVASLAVYTAFAYFGKGLQIF
jgi:hypothetical protein